MNAPVDLIETAKVAPAAGEEPAEEEITIRLAAPESRLVQAAAVLWGQSVAEFVAEAARRRAERIMEPKEVWHLTPEQSLAFVENCLDPPPPTAQMRASYQRYLEMGGRRFPDAALAEEATVPFDQSNPLDQS